MALSSVWFLRIYIIAVTEIKILELETFLMWLNTVFYEYDPRCLKNGKVLFKNVF